MSPASRFSLDSVRAQVLTVRPVCPFIKSYIDKHEEYADLLAVKVRAPSRCRRRAWRGRSSGSAAR